MDIPSIINIVNWDPQYNVKPVLEELFTRYQNLVYIGHGGTAITLKNNDTIVYKICKKNNSNMKSGDEFIKYSKLLHSNGIKILLPLEIIYETDNYIVYTQNYCDVLTKITTNNLIKILEITKMMFIKRIRPSDLYFRNFGLYDNDVVMFDYHDYTDFYSDDIYYITHMAHLFNLYKYNQLYNNNITLTIEDLINDNFGGDKFTHSITTFLKVCYHRNYDIAVRIIDNIIAEETKNLSKTYNNYQKLTIDENGVINLYSHTKDKYDFFDKFKYLLKPNSSICDMGCSIGGIGSKIAQMIPDSKVDLVNIDAHEVDICQEIKETICLSNIRIINDRIPNVKNIYDCGLYYAIVHHLMKDYTFDDILKMIKSQNRNIVIIEFPLEKDVLLQKIAKEGNLNYNQTFYYLTNLEILSNKLKEHFNILDYKQIDYGTTELYRFVFALQIIS